MINTLLLLAFALQPTTSGAVVVDRVDVIEVNTHHDDEAAPCYVQIIYWRWSDKHSRHKCEAWRLSNGATATPKLGIKPTFDYARQEWRATWHDGGILRQVQSPHARWTHTQIDDPEILDKERFPECYRRDLSKPVYPNTDDGN
jgi:hypothetical protein